MAGAAMAAAAEALFGRHGEPSAAESSPRALPAYTELPASSSTATVPLLRVADPERDGAASSASSTSLPPPPPSSTVLSLLLTSPPPSEAPSAPSAGRAAATTPELPERPLPPPPLVLCGFQKAVDGPSSSAFCQKLETFLRETQTPYIHRAVMPQTAPKGKLPYIELPPVGDDNAASTVLADSHFILRHLITSGRSRDLNAGLTAAQIAESNAWQAAWEERVYPCIVYERWVDDAAYGATAQELSAVLPWPLQGVILWSIRRGIRATLVAQGVGRHTPEEVRSFVVQAAKDAAARLEDVAVRTGQPAAYFHGTPAPTEVDVVLYAILVNSLGTAGNPTITSLVLGSASIVRYVSMMTRRLFPEYKDVLARLDAAAG